MAACLPACAAFFALPCMLCRDPSRVCSSPTLLHVLRLPALCGRCWCAATPDPLVCAAASTGLAASALGGTTLNAFAGVGRAEGTVEQLARMASRPSALQRWRRAKTLIVDEVSPGRLGCQ